MDCVGYLYVHNFFLAEAVRKRPELAERSFWIDLNGRVLAASADLALLGIRMGTPARQARRTAPGAECVKYLPEDFEPMSDLFCDIAYKFTPVVAPLRPGEVLVGPVGNSPCLARILHQCSVQ
jgi:nucleotidyltransferase/DNA polymerase involved in DNA repair